MHFTILLKSFGIRCSTLSTSQTSSTSCNSVKNNVSLIQLAKGQNLSKPSKRGIAKVLSFVRNSIEHSLANPTSALEFAKAWGRGIDEDTNEEFVRMYVNRRTIDYGKDGRRAVRMFLER